MLSGPCEIFPGIDLMVMYGHTQGMQIVKISDQTDTMLYCSDLIPTASHIPVPWVMAYDNNPLITMNEKSRLLRVIADEKWILYFEHDPLRQAATVKLTDKGYKIDENMSFLS
jgi:glyoxylase-like metal-dependent hydrolase (beta-lactamase superfamily II)